MKIQPKYLTFLTFGAFTTVFAVIIWFGVEKNIPNPAQVPDYKQEWLNMKTNGTGIFPAGLQQSWYNQSNNLRRAGGAIVDISEVGPSNVAGRIRAIIIDRSNPNHFLAAGISGGLWNSYNKGQTWIPLNDQEVTLNASCIDQSTSNPAIFYYGTGEGAGNSVGFDGDGIFKSIDTGKTFTKLMATDNANFTNAWKIKIDPQDENLVYVGTDNKGFWKTEDGGNTWKRTFNTSAEINDLDLLPDGKVMFTAKGNGIYISDNKGESFTKLSHSNLPSSAFGRIELAYCQGSYNNMYAAYSTAHSSYDGAILGVYKSQDTGKTWIQVATPNSFAVSALFTWYCKIMEVHPTDPNKIYLAAVTPGYSLDGGNTWTSASNPHADYHSVAINPHNNNEIIVGNDGGAHLYNWNNLKLSTPLVNSLNITQFYHGGYHPIDNSFTGGTQDNGTQYSVDKNAMFSRILGGDGTFSHISQQNPNIVYAASQNGNIRRVTINNGFASRTDNILNELDADRNGTIDEGARFINPFWMNYNNGAQVFFVTNRGLWRTNNSGNNWTKITANYSNLYSVGISYESDPTIYFGGSNFIYRLANAGTSTNTGDVQSIRAQIPQLSGQFVGCIRVHPTDPNHFYFSLNNVNNNSRLYEVKYANTDSLKVESLGDNLPTNLPVNSFDFDPLNPESTFVVGTDYGLFSTTDRGATWVKHTEVPNAAVVTVQTRKTDGKVFIYTHGRGAFIAQLKSGKNVSVASVNTSLEVSIYPNPSANGFSIKGVSAGVYNIYDVYGKRIKSGAFRENEWQGIFQIPAGIYLVEVKTDKGKKSIKWVKQ